MVDFYWTVDVVTKASVGEQNILKIIEYPLRTAIVIYPFRYFAILKFICISVPGICLNLLLIYLVKNYSRTELGTFRYLLIVFASYDILIIILHFIFDPVNSIIDIAQRK